MTIAVFDVDGCLVDSMTGSSLRPGAADLLSELHRHGIQLLLWSAGGADYARQRAAQHGIQHYFGGFHGKDRRDRNGHYDTRDLDPDPSRLVLIDDHPEDLDPRTERIGVSSYMRPDPNDRGLSTVTIGPGKD